MQVGVLAAEQHESLVDLLCELHTHHNDGARVSRELVRDHLLGNLLDAESMLRLFTATVERERVVGFAAVYLVHSLVEPSPETRRQCVLKELFVSASARRNRIGRALIASVARYALDSGCCRVDWSVNASNRRGIAFY